MKKLAIILSILLGFCQFLLWAQAEITEPGVSDSSADSLSTVKEDSLFYAADSMSYNYSQEQIRLFGNTSIKYQEFTISSDSLMVDLKAKRAFSYGNTVMRDGDQIMLGTDVAYDIDSQTGIMSDGVSRLEKGFYSGENIRKIDTDIYDVDDGSFTTCEYAEPDFWFSASQLRIFRNDKIVGKPVVAYINHFPVLYFPFMTVPIRRGRHPGFLIPEPGFNNVDGKFLKDIAWYYPYKDYADAILGLDLMERTGWKVKFDLDYIDRDAFSGSFNAAYQRSIRSNQTYYDWYLRAVHHQELPDKATFDVNLDFVSNKRIWESSNSLDESLAQRVTSTLSYRKPLLSSYLNVGASYTEDLIQDQVFLTLPSASFSLPSRPVYEVFYKPDRSPDAWWSNLNYNYNVRLDHTGILNDPDRSFQDLIWSNTQDPVDPTIYTQHNLGIKHNLGLSYNWKLRGWLNMQHGLTYGEAWFDRDKAGEKLVRGNDYSAYTNASFNVYGIQNYRKGWLRSLRHIITPSAGLSFNPDFSDNDRFYRFGGIGLNSSVRSANLSLSLDQKWQIKYGKDSKKIPDILSLTSRLSGNLLKDDKPFGTLSHTAYFRPGSFSLGSLKLPGSSYRLDKLSLGYTSQYSLTHDPYQLNWLDWQPSRQVFSQTVALGGSAPYSNYFSREKNRLFDPYEPRDSLQIRSEAISALGTADNWKISLTHELTGAKSILDPTVHSLRFDASLKLTANWAISYGNYYNLKTNELISQTMRITRDLHCWKLDISYTTRNEYWEYRIALFNTVLPDALRIQTRDSKRY